MAKLERQTHQQFELASAKDTWDTLKQYTDARIALGRAGCSIPSQPMLEFQLAHAQARDAVFQTLDVKILAEKLNQEDLKTLHVQSQANSKEIFLKRPDLGRLLDAESKEQLMSYRRHHSTHYDVCIVIGDGLSARAIEENAFEMILSLQSHFNKLNWSLAPIVIATGSRVALGDQVAELLNVSMLIMMIGERPGLSSPDSMGIYYTWNSQTGCLDSNRNCISNIRPAGLNIPIATQRLIELMKNSKKLQISGINLKDNHQTETVIAQQKIQSLF